MAMSRTDLVVGGSIAAVLFVPIAGIYAVRMVQGLRDAGRRALGPGVLLLLLAGVMFGVLPAVSLLFVYWLSTQLPAAAALVVFAVPVLVVALSPAGTVFTEKSFALRRQIAPDGRKLLARDQRPPIVYLRSFDEDPEESETPDSGGFVLGTYEERLLRSMRRYGPVVAIGRPGERLPPLGAARIYVDDANWQSIVSDLAAKAQLVVLRPAVREAVLWETMMAARVAGGDKLALYVRDLRADVWTAFVSLLGTTLGAPLPRALESGVIMLYVRSGEVRTLRWEQPLGPAHSTPQYVLTRSWVKPLFRS